MAKLVTGKEGTVSLYNLPIGFYYLKETDVGNHHFVLDPEAKEFEIKYQGQEVAVDYVSMELENKRQKIRICPYQTIQRNERTSTGCGSWAVCRGRYIRSHRGSDCKGRRVSCESRIGRR